MKFCPQRPDLTLTASPLVCVLLDCSYSVLVMLDTIIFLSFYSRIHMNVKGIKLRSWLRSKFYFSMGFKSWIGWLLLAVWCFLWDFVSAKFWCIMFWVICFSYLTSVGTDFMARLQEQLKYFVHNKLSTDKAWQGVNVYLSGHEVSYVTSELCVVCVSVKFFWFPFLLRPLVKESTRSWSSSVLRPPNLVITQTQDTAFMVWMPTWWVQLCITDFFFFSFPIVQLFLYLF